MKALNFTLVLVLFSIISCKPNENGVQKSSLTECGNIRTVQPAFQLPTASEIFHLRSECAALGEKLIETKPVGAALTSSQASYYNFLTNRCFIEITTQSANIPTPPDKLYFIRYLFDGQTGELLAIAQVNDGKNGGKFGMVYNGLHQISSDKNAGWDDANEYINCRMSDPVN